MFTTYEGATKLADELFFKAIDLQAIAHERDVPDRPSLFEKIICLTHETVSKFRDLVKGGKIICSFETQFIEPKNLTFAKKIKDLNPYGIDWSNVSDYTRKWDFIKFARACSVEKTVHQVHFINWNEYVYGSNHMDWADNQEECIQMYRKFKIRLNMTKKLFSEMLGDHSLLQFFEGEEYVNRLNDIIICLRCSNLVSQITSSLMKMGSP